MYTPSWNASPGHDYLRNAYQFSSEFAENAISSGQTALGRFKIRRLFLACFGGGLVLLALTTTQSNLKLVRDRSFLNDGDGIEPRIAREITRASSQFKQNSNKKTTITGDICGTSPYVIVGQPTADSVVFRLLSDFSPTVIIEWFEEGNSPQKTPPLKLVPSTPSVLLPIQDLKRSTRYSYRLIFRNSEACEEFATDFFFFHTQRLFGEGFTFAVTADSHFDDPNVYDEGVFHQTQANLIRGAHSSPGYDFLIDLGDTFMGQKLAPKLGTEHLLYEKAFKELSAIARSAPLFLANGNHDGEDGESLQASTSKGTSIEAALPVKFARLRNTYFTNPASGGIYSSNPDTFPTVGQLTNYYGWLWGNSLFVVLDPYWYTPMVNKSPWQWTLGKSQYEWVYGILGSPASLKFIFMHQYVGGLFGTSVGFTGGGDESFARFFEWGGLDPSGEYAFPENRPGWDYGPIHQICVRNHVSIVFHGHDHLYHVGQLDGVIYNVIPRTSQGIHKATLTEVHEREVDKGYPSDVLETSGHTEVSVKDTGATVSLFDPDSGSVIQQYNVAAHI